jgi:hypothetical protein
MKSTSRWQSNTALCYVDQQKGTEEKATLKCTTGISRLGGSVR